jgi:predicted DNA-binding protein
VRPKKPKKDLLKPVCVKLPPEMLKTLRAKSKAMGEPVSTVIRIALTRFIETKDWIV